MQVLRICLIFVSFSLFSCSKPHSGPELITFPSGEKVDITSLNTDIGGLSNTYALMKTPYGNISFRFYTKSAPKTSVRIMQLIQNGFYDNLPFHRVIENFLIQTGDPTDTGKGGSGQKLDPEFNSIQHIKGTIGLARSVDEKSGDSQFYIALTTLPHLDGKYTVFAQVVDGIDLLSKIKPGDRIESIRLTLER